MVLITACFDRTLQQSGCLLAIPAKARTRQTSCTEAELGNQPITDSGNTISDPHARESLQVQRKDEPVVQSVPGRKSVHPRGLFGNCRGSGPQQSERSLNPIASVLVFKDLDCFKVVSVVGCSYFRFFKLQTMKHLWTYNSSIFDFAKLTSLTITLPCPELLHS